MAKTKKRIRHECIRCKKIWFNENPKTEPCPQCGFDRMQMIDVVTDE